MKRRYARDRSLIKTTKSAQGIKKVRTLEGRFPKLNKELIKETGLVESQAFLEKYICRLLFGICYTFNGKTWNVFTLPDEKDRLQSYLREVDPNKGIMVDLSPVAICLLVDKNYMYTLQKIY